MGWTGRARAPTGIALLVTRPAAECVPAPVAATRARLMNWCYLGFAISSTKLDPEQLKRVIRDLSQLARRTPDKR